MNGLGHHAIQDLQREEGVLPQEATIRAAKFAFSNILQKGVIFALSWRCGEIMLPVMAWAKSISCQRTRAPEGMTLFDSQSTLAPEEFYTVTAKTYIAMTTTGLPARREALPHFSYENMAPLVRHKTRSCSTMHGSSITRR